jgi:hypothetical protein
MLGLTRGGEVIRNQLRIVECEVPIHVVLSDPGDSKCLVMVIPYVFSIITRGLKW